MTITLRGLPLPAKLVLSCFLVAVGMGYFSAMVQLHLQHSNREGEPLPTVADVVERFSGLRKFDGKPGASKAEHLLRGDPHGAISKENMAPAFFGKSKGYEAECAARGKAAVDAEREGERQLLLAWVRQPADAQKKSYEEDKFQILAELSATPVTAKYVDQDAKTVAVRTLVTERCQKCHDQQAPPLGTFAELLPIVTPPSQEVLPGGWVRSQKQMSVEGLTQSTHAHLLSFAVLFTLTGLTFAFTTYHVAVRCVFAPLVLVAQVADVSCWWLARLPDVGPYFAMAIIATGSAVGAGLVTQIVGGLFNMYGPRGKVVVAVVLLAGLAGLGTLFGKVLNPALEAEKTKAVAAAKPEPAKPADVAAAAPKKEEPKATLSQFERLVAGPRPGPGVDWNGGPKGSMAAAFFEKSDGWKAEIKERPVKEVEAEREGEQQSVLAWMKLPDPARKAAFEADKLPFVPKAITEAYRGEDKKSVKVKSILTDRCVTCHQKGGNTEDFPLETYEQMLKYLAPEKK